MRLFTISRAAGVLMGFLLAVSSCMWAEESKQPSAEKRVVTQNIQEDSPQSNFVQEISSAEFDDIINDERGVFIEFYLPNCKSCKEMRDEYERVAEELLKQDIHFFRIRYDQAKEIAQHYQVQWVPMVFFFQNGTVVDKQVGTKTFEEFYDKIKLLLQKDVAQ